MFVLLVQVCCFQSSFFNNLSERRICVISKLPSKLDGLIICLHVYIINYVNASAIFQVGLYFKKYIAF